MDQIAGTSTSGNDEDDGQASATDAVGSLDQGPEWASLPYVYAIGRVEPRFPTLSVEKEFAQSTGKAATTGLTDRQALHAVLSNRQNRHLLRQLCWVLSV